MSVIADRTMPVLPEADPLEIPQAQQWRRVVERFDVSVGYPRLPPVGLPIREHHPASGEHAAEEQRSLMNHDVVRDLLEPVLPRKSTGNSGVKYPCALPPSLFLDFDRLSEDFCVGQSRAERFDSVVCELCVRHVDVVQRHCDERGNRCICNFRLA